MLPPMAVLSMWPLIPSVHYQSSRPLVSCYWPFLHLPIPSMVPLLSLSLSGPLTLSLPPPDALTLSLPPPDALTLSPPPHGLITPAIGHSGD